MQEWSEEVVTAASMYYAQGETMETIARHLGTSRSTVSRLLKEARETGLVRISLNPHANERSSVSTTLERLFGLNVTVVQVRDTASELHRLNQVARIAAQVLSESVHDDMTVGVAWGTTMAAIVEHLTPRPLHGVRVVQLNGGANSSSTGIPYVGAIVGAIAQSWSATPLLFPVPAFFDFAETKRAMWRERSVQAVLAVQRQVDVAIFGVGSLTAALPSHVYSQGYLDEDDMAEIARDRVIGDVCTVLLRSDGSWRDVALNSRATGPNPTELQAFSRRICVVAGTAKAGPLLAALRAKVATDLIVDDATARAVLDLM
ncbi:sugar-binding transcriptional regulator [Propionibacteriaceae bacterium G57]|uniref:sugar-binding transcriptional regulator n=1 Tax=Aestuariimicrobium sp. G57 TaxID=3418485 RepID=UPI003DA74392